MAGYKRKRGKDAWFLEVTIGTDFTGKPVRYSKTVHCKSEREADRELSRFYTECADGKVGRQNPMKVSDFAEFWFSEYAQRHFKRSAQSGAKTAKDIWIVPILGNKKLSKLSRMDVQSWINHMDDEGLSPKTIRNYYSTLRSIMDFAIDLELIEDTPCRNIRLPKKIKHEAKYYNVEEVKRLMSALQSLGPDDQKFKVAVLVILFGGLRRGEVLGLNWDDIDFKRGQIHIHRNRMIGRAGTVYEDTPKTESSIRYVTLPPQVLSEMKRLKAQQSERQLLLGPQYHKTPAMLQGEVGDPLHPQVLQRWFVRLIESAGLPKLGLHGLRHTHTSMLSHMNVDKMQISKRLGHSELSTTLDIYTHLFEDADQQIADELASEYAGFLKDAK